MNQIAEHHSKIPYSKFHKIYIVIHENYSDVWWILLTDNDEPKYYEQRGDFSLRDVLHLNEVETNSVCEMKADLDARWSDYVDSFKSMKFEGT